MLLLRSIVSYCILILYPLEAIASITIYSRWTKKVCQKVYWKIVITSWSLFFLCIKHMFSLNLPKCLISRYFLLFFFSSSRRKMYNNLILFWFSVSGKNYEVDLPRRLKTAARELGLEICSNFFLYLKKNFFIFLKYIWNHTSKFNNFVSFLLF